MRHKTIATMFLSAAMSVAACTPGRTTPLAPYGSGTTTGNGNASPGPGPTGTPMNPNAMNGNSTTTPVTTFSEGLWRVEDPRITQKDKMYYSVAYQGHNLTMWKHASLVDRGIGKPVPVSGTQSYPLMSPVYIGSLGGVTYNAWFAFDNNVWECQCTDPYDDLGQWKVIGTFPFTGWSIDFHVYQNTQPGMFQNHWYMIWAGADSPSTGWGPESVFTAEITNLNPPTLSTYDNNSNNRLVANDPTGWKAVVAEAPGTAINGNDVNIVYTGNGAQTTAYALGVSMLKPGADPTLAASWIDHNAGGCDGDVVNAPEFATNGNAFGPGVARFIKSADGTEDYMMYRTKTFDTGTVDTQDINLMWVRHGNLVKTGWRKVTCAGASYNIPDMGKADELGISHPLPSGDPGPQAGMHKIEAESLIPFGVLGATVKALPRDNNDPDVISIVDPNFSNGEKITNIDKLAADVATTPKQSGLIWNNSPGGKTLQVAAANAAAASFDLYVGGQLAQTLMLPASGGAETVKVTSFTVDIPTGADVRFVFEVGKSAPADLDYFTLSGD